MRGRASGRLSVGVAKWKMMFMVGREAAECTDDCHLGSPLVSRGVREDLVEKKAGENQRLWKGGLTTTIVITPLPPPKERLVDQGGPLWELLDGPSCRLVL